MAFNLKGYVEVKDRIKAFNEDETKKGWKFITKEIDSARPKGVDLADGLNASSLGYTKFICEVYDEDGTLRATGHAQESEFVGSRSDVNKTSYVENCETSAIGRALGMLGYGIDKSIASKDEIDRAKAQKQPMYEVFNEMYITEAQAKKMVGTSITQLLQKLGARKEDLANLYAEKTMGGKSSDASINQLMNLEKALRTANNTDSDWHSLYGQNSRVKEPVPKNQEILYKPSKVRFGLKALEMAEDDDTKLAIIEYYQNGGFDLNKSWD